MFPNKHNALHAKQPLRPSDYPIDLYECLIAHAYMRTCTVMRWIKVTMMYIAVVKTFSLFQFSSCVTIMVSALDILYIICMLYHMLWHIEMWWFCSYNNVGTYKTLTVLVIATFAYELPNIYLVAVQLQLQLMLSTIDVYMICNNISVGQ